MRYMDHAYLLETERTTQVQFEAHLSWYRKGFVSYIDTLFAMSNFVHETVDGEDNWFPHIMWQRLIHVPHGFRAAYLLASRGYNAEGYIVLRHVLEVFVQLRYFSAHRERLRPHLETKSAKNRISFKTMFDEFSPGYYGRYYSLASGVAHAGLHFSAVSMTLDPVAQRVDAPLGCEFNARKASMVINQSLMLMLGFFIQVPVWSRTYLANVSSQDKNIEERRSIAIEELDGWRKGHRGRFADSHEWIDMSTLLIGGA